MTDNTSDPLEADHRGRVNLGSDYAGETVRVQASIVSDAAMCPNECADLKVYITDTDEREIRCPVCGYVGGRV